MQGRKNHVTGQGRLHRNLGGFAVTDFSNHDNIGILAQDRTQARSEGQLDFGVDLNLTDTVELIFNRVFDGDNVFAAIVEPAQGGIQGGRFPRTGGPGDQKNAMGLKNQLLDLLTQLVPQPHLAQFNDAAALFKQA